MLYLWLSPAIFRTPTFCLWLPLVYSLDLWACFVFVFKIPHVSEIRLYLSFSVWLSSLSIMSSGLSQVVRQEDYILFYGWIIPHCMYILQFLHPLTLHWTLRLYPILAIIENTAVNFGGGCIMLILVVFSFSLDMCPKVLSELLELWWFYHTGVLFLIFWGTSILFP